MKSLVVFLLLIAVLSARENPFHAAQKESIADASMEKINSVDRLQSLTITPPVESVKIRRITIEYLNVDGEKIKRVYEIDKGIDPLKTLKVTQ